MVAAQEKRTQEWEQELMKGAKIELMLDKLGPAGAKETLNPVG